MEKLCSRSMKKILLIRPDRIGDVIVSTACLQAVRNRFPDSIIYFMAAPHMESLFYRHPSIDKFISISHRTTEAVAIQLTALDLNVIVHLQPDPIFEVAAMEASIEIRIGFKSKKNRQSWLTHSKRYEKQKGKKHEARYAFELLEYLDIEEPCEIWANLSPDPACYFSLIKKLPQALQSNKYAVIHVGSHGYKPKIPINYLDSIARTLAKRGLGVVLVGASLCDFQISEQLCNALSHSFQLYNLCQKTSLAELAWLMQKAEIVISRDSGPAHLAAAMGVITVTHFMVPNVVNSSNRWHPLGRNVYIIEHPMRKYFWESDERFAKRNLRKVSIEKVLDIIDRSLSSDQSIV